MIFGELVGIKLPGICFTGEEKPRIKLHPGNLSDRRSNPGPLSDRPARYLLLHSGGTLIETKNKKTPMLKHMQSFHKKPLKISAHYYKQVGEV